MEFPKWQLHRGFWKEGVRENTMEAFRQAKAMGCSMVELDVQLSKDKVFHVYHDKTLKRVFKVDQKVSSLRSEDLTGLNIPRLQDVLESSEVPDYLNIEVKSKGLFPVIKARVLTRLLHGCDHKKKIMVSSFNPMFLTLFRFHTPDVPRALIVGDKKRLTGSLFEWELKLAQPDFLNCHYSLIDDEEAREFVLYYEKPIMLWTVNAHDKAEFYLKRGAKSIISDLPPKGDY